MEPRADRRALAEAAGATALAGPEPDGARRPGRGLADQVFVCTTNREAIAGALHLAGPGGVVQLFAPTPPGELVGLDLRSVFFREVSIQSTCSAGPFDTRDALALLASGAVDLGDAGLAPVPLDEVAEAFRLARSGEATKVVVEP